VSDVFAVVAHVAILAVTVIVLLLYKSKEITVSGNTDGFDEGVERVERELGGRFPGRRPGTQTQSAYGTIGDATVSITLDTDREGLQGKAFTELVVTVDAPRVPRGISFAAEGGGDEDILTGDTVFDDLVEVHGEPSVVLALLDKDLRQKVAVFSGHGGSLTAGRLRCHPRLELPHAQIPAIVRLMIGLADGLSSAEKGGLCPRLARNAGADPLPGVRLQNLAQLQDKFTAAPEALATSRAALFDSDPWVRLAAARFLRAEVETLEAVARDRKAPDQAAAEAVALLAARMPAERVGPVLIEIVKNRTDEARRQAVEELGRLRHAPAAGPLIVLVDRADPRTAAAAATALGALEDAHAESSLIQALDSDAPELRMAAAKALGRLGGVKAVEPLMGLLSARLDTASRQAIRDAVAAIQSRLVGAEAGQLTVAAGDLESGRLSLAQPAAGAGDLSLAKPGDPPAR
jgi:HEAT repeat protein